VSGSTQVRTGFQRVTTKRPCALCSKTHGCVYDPRHGLIICMQTPSDQRIEKWMGWLHQAEPTPDEMNESACIRVDPDRKPPDAATADARNVLYGFLAGHPFCALTDTDRARLHQRSFSDEDITRLGYFSYPDRSRREQAMCDLEHFAEERGLALALWNLPGVSAKAGPRGKGFRNELMLVSRGALGIPVRDPAGRCVAVKLRRRESDMAVTGSNRYLWLGSDLAPSHAPTHTARPAAITDPERVIITEGPLKADYAAHVLGNIVLGVPGIDNQADVPMTLRALEERGELNSGARVAVAYDEEPAKPQVAKARDTLAARLTRDYTVTLLRWESEQGKGLDDLIRAGHRPTETPLATDSSDASNSPAGSEPSGQDEKPTKGRAPSQASQLLELAEGAAYFHDPEYRAWVTFAAGDHHETSLVKSQAFRRWLGWRLYASKGITANAQAMQDALGVLEGRATYDGPMQTVYARLASHDGAIYLDLANEQWGAVKITPDGWEVCHNPPVKFRRPRAMLPLPLPTHGGQLATLRDFVNVGAGDDGEQAWMLYVAWLIAALNPSGPYPPLALSGEQGSAKSTLAKVSRGLLDPNIAALRAEPKEPRDLAIAANNSWVLALDNLSSIPVWLADALCRLSTGAGFSTRTLYENDEETIFQAQRPIILTSIEDVATRNDLVDRAILLALPPIGDGKRKPEAAFWRGFEAARPAILGALLSIVSWALRELPTTKVADLPRMADFALWVTAAEHALGWERGSIVQAYQANRRGANALALESSPVAEQVITLMQSRAAWDGTPGELYAALTTQAGERVTVSPTWPKSARGLSGALKRFAPNLRQAGIAVRSYRRGDANHTRALSIRKNAGEPSEPSEPSESADKERPTQETSSMWAIMPSDGSPPLAPDRPRTVRDVSPGDSWDSDALDGSDAQSSPSSNGHVGFIVRRLSELAAVGITGDAAMRQALLDKGISPGELKGTA
jgi:hypothetical protein